MAESRAALRPPCLAGRSRGGIHRHGSQNGLETIGVWRGTGEGSRGGRVGRRASFPSRTGFHPSMPEIQHATSGARTTLQNVWVTPSLRPPSPVLPSPRPPFLHGHGQIFSFFGR